MERYRRERADARDFFAPSVGLVVIGLLFIPELGELLGSWFAWIVGLLVLGVAALWVRAIWRRLPVKAERPEPLLPIFIHSDEEREQFRALMGVKEIPRAPIKVVTPETDAATSAGDSPPSP